jgi:crotonobetainyl-CoA:carnitine CoA-transferase CaiB-like acyl-CoA transferase
MKLRGADIGPRGPAPELGQHTREVLRELGLSEAEVDAAVADGVVGAGA